MKQCAVVLSIISAILAFAAAVLWFLSARIKTPSSFGIHVVKPDGMLGVPFGGNPIGGTYQGQGYSPDLQKLGEGLSRQAQLSAQAAVCAGASAATQAIAVFICPAT